MEGLLRSGFITFGFSVAISGRASAVRPEQYSRIQGCLVADFECESQVKKAGLIGAKQFLFHFAVHPGKCAGAPGHRAQHGLRPFQTFAEYLSRIVGHKVKRSVRTRATDIQIR